jgi:diguanylate cyclase (GGDEF)-like protein
MKEHDAFFSRLRNNFVRARRIDWSRDSVKDAVVIFGAAIVAIIVVAWSDFSDAFLVFLQKYDDWYLDDLVMASFVVNVGLVIYAFRRLKDLSNEFAARGEAELNAIRLARHDPLTGLPNRRFFAQTLEETLRHLKPSERAAILMLDLDGFKAVNDTYGHAEGDRALLAVGSMLAGLLHNATLARVGGDEFAIIVPRMESHEGVAALARRIVAGFLEPLAISNELVSLGVSIGIVVAPDDGSSPELLVRRADLAMYRAKAEGRSLIAFYNPEMEVFVENRARMEQELRRAVAADTIVPHYQPIVSLNGNRIIGFEALARWRGEGERMLPEQFIPLAEETGLISRLGDQLLRRACLDAKTWPPDLFLAFNMSSVQLRDPGVGLRVMSILGETGFDPRRLEIEITESVLIKSTEVAQKLVNELRAAGVSVALDDFGIGYSTLTQLTSFQFDKIKIDRSFVQRLGEDAESLVIVRAILGLAKGFGLISVAEGVEREDQRACLENNGCSEGQGYLFGKAVPATEIATLLTSQHIISKVA